MLGSKIESTEKSKSRKVEKSFYYKVCLDGCDDAYDDGREGRMTGQSKKHCSVSTAHQKDLTFSTVNEQNIWWRTITFSTAHKRESTDSTVQKNNILKSDFSCVSQ